MLWVMNKTAIPRSALKRCSSLMICAWDRDIQCGCRFVSDEELRSIGQCHCDHGSLRHPATELVGILAQAALRVGNPHALQQIQGALPGSAATYVVVFEDRFLDLEADGEHGIEPS